MGTFYKFETNLMNMKYLKAFKKIVTSVLITLFKKKKILNVLYSSYLHP